MVHAVGTGRDAAQHGPRPQGLAGPPMVVGLDDDELLQPLG